MTIARRVALAAFAAVVLSGCSTINSLTGQTDNTVLPGKREDAVPGRTQFPDKPDANVGAPPTSTVSGSGADDAYCAPDDASCKPPTTTGETFKDPQ
jgi:hypothetical protein